MSSRTRSLKPRSVARVLNGYCRNSKDDDKDATSEEGETAKHEMAAHRKVSLRIFSLTSQGPLATYSRNVSAGKSLTLSRIFHILYRSVGSCGQNKNKNKNDERDADVGEPGQEAQGSTYRLRRDALDENEPAKLLHAFLHVLRRSRFRRQLWL